MLYIINTIIDKAVTQCYDEVIKIIINKWDCIVDFINILKFKTFFYARHIDLDIINEWSSALPSSTEKFSKLGINQLMISQIYFTVYNKRRACIYHICLYLVFFFVYSIYFICIALARNDHNILFFHSFSIKLIIQNVLTTKEIIFRFSPEYENHVILCYWFLIQINIVTCFSWLKGYTLALCSIVWIFIKKQHFLLIFS